MSASGELVMEERVKISVYNILLFITIIIDIIITAM